jgi:hypothetical protein
MFYITHYAGAVFHKAATFGRMVKLWEEGEPKVMALSRQQKKIC